MTQLVDIHAHIQFNAFKDDADQVIQRALDAGVRMVAPSSQISTSERSLFYAEKYPNQIFAAVGLHPIHLKPTHFDASEDGAPAFETRVEEFSYEHYKELAASPHVVAIGETGLDYAERLHVSEADRRGQEKLFRRQIELSLDVGKPIIQHCRSGPVGDVNRDAHDDALTIIGEYISRGLHGVAHCYSGNLDEARRYIALGFYLSFTGLITFVDAWEEVIREIPLERIMVETDCPYMTPVPHRGTRNEPLYVEFVARKVAEIKRVPFEDAARITTENAVSLFGLPSLP